MNLYKAILKQYGSDVAGGIGSFSEMGFLLGEFATNALRDDQRSRTRSQSVNAAFKAIKDYKTEMLCQPWMYGNYPLHIPNNTDFTITPNNGKMVLKQGCMNDLLGRSADRGVPQRRGYGGDRTGTADGVSEVSY